MGSSSGLEKAGRKDTFDQVVRSLAAATMAERDLFVAQVEFMAARLPCALNLVQHFIYACP